MSNATELSNLLTTRAAIVLRVSALFVAITAVVGVLAFVALHREPDGASLAIRTAEVRTAQVLSAAQSAAEMPSSDSGVPQAGAALIGRDPAIEEPTPTF